MRVLVIAPHPDDEVLGVGGTMAKRAQAGDDVYVCIVTKGLPPLFSKRLIDRGREEHRAASHVLGVKETIFLDFPASLLDTVPLHELNDKLASVIQQVAPEEVYIPHRGDMHFDHMTVADAAMVALRPKYDHVVKRVYAYEVLSETGWHIPNVQNDFIPNVYEDISETIDRKLEAMHIYQSQLQMFPAARSLEALEALAKFRGATVNVRAAEAFYLVREIRMGGKV